MEDLFLLMLSFFKDDTTIGELTKLIMDKEIDIDALIASTYDPEKK